MTKKTKITLIILSVIIGLIAVWYAYQVTTAKPVDPSLRDGRKAAQEYLKQRKEYYLNKQNNGDQ